MPAEIAAVLATQPSAFGPIEEWQAMPEVVLELDEFGGAHRHTDLLVNVRDSHGKYLTAVEAKADESFSETVADALAAAVDRGLGPKHSNGVARVQRLAAALFDPREKVARPHGPRLGRIRYQLLTATAGVLREAATADCPRAVFLVHEFHTFATNQAKLQANAEDLNVFVARISRGKYFAVEPGRLYGPIRVPGFPDFPALPELYIGKAVREVPDPMPNLRVLAQHGVDKFLLGDSPTATNGFVAESHLVAPASPVRELESGNWQAPVIDLVHQSKLICRAKATL